MTSSNDHMDGRVGLEEQTWIGENWIFTLFLLTKFYSEFNRLRKGRDDHIDAAHW